MQAPRASVNTLRLYASNSKLVNWWDQSTEIIHNSINHISHINLQLYVKFIRQSGEKNDHYSYLLASCIKGNWAMSWSSIADCRVDRGRGDPICHITICYTIPPTVPSQENWAGHAWPPRSDPLVFGLWKSNTGVFKNYTPAVARSSFRAYGSDSEWFLLWKVDCSFTGVTKTWLGGIFCRRAQWLNGYSFSVKTLVRLLVHPNAEKRLVIKLIYIC